MGDFNEWLGRCYEVWKGIIGHHGVGNCNDSGNMLLELSAETGLTITNMIFQQKARFKMTWKHWWSQHLQLLDYILIYQKESCGVLHTRGMPSAYCCTDHRLVRAMMWLRIRPTPWRKGPQVKRLLTDNLCLKRMSFRANFKADFKEKNQKPKTKTGKNSGLNWRLYCKKQQQKWLAFLQERTRTGLIKMTQKSKNSSRKSATVLLDCWLGQMTSLLRLHTDMPTAYSAPS